MRNISITTGEIYHVCNKSIEGRPIFTRYKDCVKFLETIHNILFSSENSTPGVTPGVEFSSLTLMPNHFHFLIKQTSDNGIPVLMQRLCNSYGKYFNQKYERGGSLFVGPYKAVHINSDTQLEHIFTYIHANPLDLVEPRWREGEIIKWSKAKTFLSNYEWSSLGTYISTFKSHPIIDKIINKNLAKNFFKNHNEHIEAIKNWGLRNKNDITEIDLRDFE